MTDPTPSPALSKVKILVGGWFFRPWIGRIIHRIYGGSIPCGPYRFRLEIGGVASYQEVARLYLGYYEKAEREFVLRYLRPDLDVIELGGGIGVIASFVHGKQAAGRTHLCVEGSPQAIAALKANVQRNLPERKPPTVVHAAINYATSGKTHFRVDENILGSSVAEASASFTEVPTTTLAEVYRASGMTDFALVCDIEGAEAGLLRQEAETLKHRRQIIVELHPAEFGGKRFSVLELDAMITRLGFGRTASHGNVFVHDAAPL